MNNPSTKSIKSTVKTKYHPNGIIESKTSYVKRINHGVDIGWYSNGQKWYEQIHKQSKKYGSQKWWHVTGAKMWEETCVEGESHGVAREGDEYGNKLVEVYYLQGREYARIDWDEEGSVIKSDFPSQHSQPTQPVINKIKNLPRQGSNNLSSLKVNKKTPKTKKI